jgi:REP element-mobilizing transposase RayT
MIMLAKMDFFRPTKGMVTMHLYHGKSLRHGRYCEIGRPYLLTTVTHRRKQFFRDFRLARIVVAELRDVTERGFVDTLAWVIMPDHLHWLIVLRNSDLGKIVNRVKSRSAIFINREINGSGQIWQHGFHDHALRKEEHIEEVARYVVANPLRAGIVRRLGDYPHWDACWV